MNKLDALVCIGGNGTQKNAYHLAQKRFKYHNPAKNH